MTIRKTLTGLTAAFVLGAGALMAGSLAGATSAEARHGWHGGHGHHGHFGHHHGRHWGWGRPGWGRPIYAGGYYGCYTVLRSRFIPGLGFVERPVTRCR